MQPDKDASYWAFRAGLAEGRLSLAMDALRKIEGSEEHLEATSIAISTLDALRKGIAETRKEG